MRGFLGRTGMVTRPDSFPSLAPGEGLRIVLAVSIVCDRGGLKYGVRILADARHRFSSCSAEARISCGAVLITTLASSVIGEFIFGKCEGLLGP